MIISLWSLLVLGHMRVINMGGGGGGGGGGVDM